jgi:hypothetical protein
MTGRNVVAGSATGTGIIGLWHDNGVESFAGRDPASGLPIRIIRYQEENVCRPRYRKKEWYEEVCEMMQKSSSSSLVRIKVYHKFSMASPPRQ